MLMRTFAISLSIAVLAAAATMPACGDSSPANTDGSLADGAQDGSAAKEQGAGDKGVSDKGVGDNGTNETSTGDGPAVDSTPTDGTRPDRGNVDTGNGDGSTAARCQHDTDCKVFQDCCSCSGVLSSANPPICKKACKRSTCDVWFSQPVAYCVNGRCKVGEGKAGSCSSTTKACKLINDCCNCLAVPPTNTAIPACSIKACLVATCTAERLAKARALCISGTCRLSVP